MAILTSLPPQHRDPISDIARYIFLLLALLLLTAPAPAQVSGTGIAGTAHYVAGGYEEVNPGFFLSYDRGRVVSTVGLVSNSLGTSSVFVAAGLGWEWGLVRARVVVGAATGYSSGLPAGAVPTSLQVLSIGGELRLSLFHVPGAFGAGVTVSP